MENNFFTISKFPQTTHASHKSEQVLIADKFLGHLHENIKTLPLAMKLICWYRPIAKVANFACVALVIICIMLPAKNIVFNGSPRNEKNTGNLKYLYAQGAMQCNAINLQDHGSDMGAVIKQGQQLKQK